MTHANRSAAKTADNGRLTTGTGSRSWFPIATPGSRSDKRRRIAMGERNELNDVSYAISAPDSRHNSRSRARP